MWFLPLSFPSHLFIAVPQPHEKLELLEGKLNKLKEIMAEEGIDGDILAKAGIETTPLKSDAAANLTSTGEGSQGVQSANTIEDAPS